MNIGRLAVKVKILSPEDSLGKAAEAARTSTVGAAPVVQNGRMLGLATAEQIAAVLSHVPPREVTALSVAALPLESTVALPESMSAQDALMFFQVNDLQRAPVLDPLGGLVGMVSQAELAMAVCGRVKPPMVGGMATPFGVYLTGGGVRGGVGDLALVTTGMYVTTLQAVAIAITSWLLSPGGLVGKVEWLSRWLGPQAHVGESLPFMIIWFALFGLLFRLSWITGYHAAEHQVVHTLEAGDDLRPEVVREKPRVHPRCGTNLVVAVTIMWVFWSNHQWDFIAPIGPMLITLFLWRRVGAWVQQNVTTRPATPRQLDSGIVAAQQLLERYQQSPSDNRNIFRRIWNMGLPQVMLGGALVMGILSLLQLAGVPMPPGLEMW